MNIFLLGATPRFDVTDFPKIADKLAQTGGNSGNQLIAYGLLQPLLYSKVEWDHREGSSYVNENFDVILIAAANFLFPGFDFGGMANFIEQTKLPVVIAGLGAQSRDYSPKIELKPGTLRLVRVLAERAKLIGVRGAFTAQVLAEMGVHNVQVIGCPSFYMNGANESLLTKPTLPEQPRIAINGSRDVLRHAFDRDKMLSVVSGLVSEAIRYDGVFIAQTEKEEMILAEESDSPEATQALNQLAAFFAKTVPNESELRAWATKNTRIYWSIETWLEDMKKFDFVAGTRFHGAMAALNVGTPAFVLCHDTRTSEMSEFLGLPHVNIGEINRIDIRELYERVDIASVIQRRRELMPAYGAFLDANGLKHRIG